MVKEDFIEFKNFALQKIQLKKQKDKLQTGKAYPEYIQISHDLIILKMQIKNDKSKIVLNILISFVFAYTF